MKEIRRILDGENKEADSKKVEGNGKDKLTVESVGNHVYFYAYVDSDRCLALIKQLREIDTAYRNEYVSRDLGDLDYPQTPIWLHVQSGGGGVFAALALIDQLKRIKTPIFSIVEGYSASAATLISMSCTKRFIMPSAYMLIHQLSSVSWGTYEEIKDEVHLLDMLMDTLTGFYKTNSKLTEKRIKDLLKRDSWFNAKECIEIGLADEILDKE